MQAMIDTSVQSCSLAEACTISLLRNWVKRHWCSMQVQEPDGTWNHLLLPQDRIAVLTGHTLERAACGLIPAAKHRVVRPYTSHSHSLLGTDISLASSQVILWHYVQCCLMHSKTVCLSLSAFSTHLCLQLVGAPGGCPAPRNALVYKLRARETAVLNMYSSLSQHDIIPRYL